MGMDKESRTLPPVIMSPDLFVGKYFDLKCDYS